MATSLCLVPINQRYRAHSLYQSSVIDHSNFQPISDYINMNSLIMIWSIINYSFYVFPPILQPIFPLAAKPFSRYTRYSLTFPIGHHFLAKWLSSHFHSYFGIRSSPILEYPYDLSLLCSWILYNQLHYWNSIFFLRIYQPLYQMHCLMSG